MPTRGEPPPSLLQMAQGIAPAMGGGGGVDLSMLGQIGADARGSPALGDDPILNSALSSGQWRPITSPEDQNYSDYQGRPIHVGGAAPAYDPRTTMGGYNAVFDARAPSSTGGWFTMEDYYKGTPDGRNPEGHKNAYGPPPNYKAPSTNNWQLLGNDPDQFMINGNIISRRKIQSDLAPKSVLGLEGGTGFPGYQFAGEGQWRYPIGSYAWMEGPIGSQGNWPIVSTPTY